MSRMQSEIAVIENMVGQQKSKQDKKALFAAGQMHSGPLKPSAFKSEINPFSSQRDPQKRHNWIDQDNVISDNDYDDENEFYT